MLNEGHTSPKSVVKAVLEVRAAVKSESEFVLFNILNMLALGFEHVLSAHTVILNRIPFCRT